MQGRLGNVGILHAQKISYFSVNETEETDKGTKGVFVLQSVTAGDVWQEERETGPSRNRMITFHSHSGSRKRKQEWD